MVTNLRKVFFAKPEQRRAVKLRVPSNAVVGVRVQLFAVAIAPDFLGLISALHIDHARIPIRLLARNIISTFQQEDLLARWREFRHERTAAGAGSNDDYVVVP